MEKDNQLSTPIGRAERAERLRNYFDLQLRFAEAMAATAVLPLADTVAYYTNCYRRFGLGRWHDAPIAPEWHTYTARLMTLDTHDFAYHSGWRRGEIAQLAWCDVEDEVIRLRPEISKTRDGQNTNKEKRS